MVSNYNGTRGTKEARGTRGTRGNNDKQGQCVKNIIGQEYILKRTAGIPGIGPRSSAPRNKL